MQRDAEALGESLQPILGDEHCARARRTLDPHPSYIHGRSPVHAGLVLLPAFAMLAALAPLLGRVGPGAPMALGGRTATARA